MYTVQANQNKCSTIVFRLSFFRGLRINDGIDYFIINGIFKGFIPEVYKIEIENEGSFINIICLIAHSTNDAQTLGNCKRRKRKWKWKRVVKITSYYSSAIENGGNLWLVWAIGHNV